MPFQKGHAPYPSKSTMPGRNKAASKASRDIALATRERASADVLVEFNVAIAMGKRAVLAEDEDGELYVDEDEDGITPTLDQRIQAVQWLSLRGWGQPAQSIHLEGHLRAHVAQLTATTDLGALGPGGVIALRRMLEGRLAGGNAGALTTPASAGDASRALPSPASAGDAPGVIDVHADDERELVPSDERDERDE